MQSSDLILGSQGCFNGACRAVVAILAPLKKSSERHVGFLSTDVQAMEQPVNITRVGDENVVVILTKALMVNAIY
jgi:hypothetical protein